MLGFGNTNGNGQRNTFIGRNNSCPNGVNGCITMGFAQTNNTISSMLLGISANIRTSSTTCDLGTTANPFQNLYLNTGIESTAGLVIGPVTATSIAIEAALSSGSWYSTTTYNPSFAAGVNRLTPPTAAVAGTLVDFTHALGVLTYTGARTRQFRIAYNVTFTAEPQGTNMIFFNSIAASTTIGNHNRDSKLLLNLPELK